MPEISEGNYLGDILKWEQEKRYSRKVVTLLAGQDLALGAVLGRITRMTASAPASPAVVGVGNGTMSNVRPGPEVQTGNYVATCTAAAANGGTFTVVAPDGTILPALTLTVGAGAATNYVSNHLNFTLTDGSVDFAAGASFTVAVTAGGTPAVVGTGNGTIGAISLGKLAQHGTYRVQCTAAATNAGTFSVLAPDGKVVGLPITVTGGAGGTASFASDHVNFTVTDGATDFAAGDYFHIVVANGSGKMKALDPLAVDGSQDAAGFTISAYDATSGDLPVVAIIGDAVIDADNLSWAVGVTSAQKATALAQLAELGIIHRNAA